MSPRHELLRSMDRVCQRVSGCEEGFGEFIAASDYPALHRQLESAQAWLATLGLSELLWSAVEQSEGLLRAGRIAEAQSVLQRAMDTLARADT